MIGGGGGGGDCSYSSSGGSSGSSGGGGRGSGGGISSSASTIYKFKETKSAVDMHRRRCNISKHNFLTTIIEGVADKILLSYCFNVLHFKCLHCLNKIL